LYKVELFNSRVAIFRRAGLVPHQNRRQARKFSVGVFNILKFDKNSTDL